jgi:hypothetical protein
MRKPAFSSALRGLQFVSDAFSIFSAIALAWPSTFLWLPFLLVAFLILDTI